MTMLEDVRRLAEEFQGLPDERPAWLRDLDTDPTSVYYRYFYEFARRFRPRVAFEIGTCEGKSAAHLAAGNPLGWVISVDIRQEAKLKADALMLPNLVTVVGDSLGLLATLKYLPPIDLLFIDGEHTFRRVQDEYEAYRPYVARDGIIFFDDIRISREMEVLWERLPEPKVALDRLHYTGFGAVQNCGPALTNVH